MVRLVEIVGNDLMNSETKKNIGSFFSALEVCNDAKYTTLLLVIV
jgi:hypothetical protein